MAFTDAQKVDIRFYMGWPQTFLQTYSALEYAMQAVELKAEMQAKVLVVLDSLYAIDGYMTNAYTRIKADQIGEIKLGRMSEINILRSEGRRLVGRLSALLNTKPLSDAFAGNSSQGRSNNLTIV